MIQAQQSVRYVFVLYVWIIAYQWPLAYRYWFIEMI